MPFINTKYSQTITPVQEEQIKSELGKAVSVLGKSENWLMLGFEPECSLWFRGEKPEKLAFVDVSLYGRAEPAACEAMTAEICRILGTALGISADMIYVKYTATDNWGWNGGNF